MRIEWTPSLSVGIEEIDRGQRELHAAAQRLVEAIGSSDGELEALLRRLLEAARAQFAEEERWLRQAEDPALVRHAHEHQRFLDDLAAAADHLARGERAAVDALDLPRYVGAWIASHVSRSDRDLARAARSATGARKVPAKPAPV